MQTAQACFGAKHRMYRELNLPGPSAASAVVLRQDEVVSALHKFTRRGHSGPLLHLLQGFYQSMAELCAAGTCTTSQRGAATAVTNRLAITLLEEGVLTAVRHSPRLIREVCLFLPTAWHSFAGAKPASIYAQVVADLVALDAANAEQTYTTCATLAHKLLANVHNAPRRRDISYVSALVRGGHEACEDLPLEFQRTMSFTNLDNLKQESYAKVKDKVCAALRMYAPHLLPLTKTAMISQNGEFRRVLYMVAVCTPHFDRAFAVKTYDALPFDDLVPVPFSREDLEAWGVFDLHTARGRGDASGGVDVWIEQSIVCASGESEERLFGLTYAELEAYYQDLKRREQAEPKRKKVAAPAAEKKKRKTEASQRTMLEFVAAGSGGSSGGGGSGSGGSSPPQGTIFAAAPHARLQGWKNLTIRGQVVGGVEGFAPGADVFVKARERPASVHATVQGYATLAWFGLPAVHATSLWCVLDRAMWERHVALAPAKHQNRLQLAIARTKHDSSDGATQLLVTEWFDGDMLMDTSKVPDGDARLASETFAWDMLRVMVLNKWMGHGDFNEHNVMVGRHGEVLRVDMAYLEEARITGVGFRGNEMPVNERGFQTAQPFRRKLVLERVCALVGAQPARVAAFLQKVRCEGGPARGRGVRSRWFDTEACVEALARGEAQAVQAFQADVKEYEEKKKDAKC